MFRRSITPLLIGTLILRASSGASTVILGLFLAHFAAPTAHVITNIQVGLLPVAFYVSELSLALFMGGLGDRWGRRRFMIIGPVFGLVHAALFFFTPVLNPLPYLLSLQVLAGISGAMTTPAVLGYLADFTMHNQGQRMRIMSFYELVTTGGIATGTVLGGFAWDHFKRYSFFLLALLYVIVSVCMALAPKVAQIVDHGGTRVVLTRYLHILRTPRLFIFIPAWLCISALLGVWFSSQITFILSSPVHRPQQLLMGSLSGAGGGHLLSLILGGFVLFFGVCLLFWAFFLNKVPRLRLMLLSVAGVYIACVALFGMNHVDGRWLYVWVPLLLLGIFAETSFAPSALSYLADISEDAAKDRGLLMGLYSVFLGLGQMLGNGLGGVFARDFGFDGLIYLTVILAAVALVSLLWLFKQEHPRLA